MAKKVILQHSSGLTENTPSVPQAKDLNYGELAINYNATEPVLIIKDSSNQIVTFGSVKANHNHDDRYYKQDEIDSFLAGKSSTNHTHPQYSLTSHTHSQYSTTGHTHDGRYYTEAEVDSFLAGKSNTGHTHDASAITGGTIAYARISGLIGTSAETIAAGNHTHDLSKYSLTGHTHDDRYYTETEVDAKLAGKAASGHTNAIAGSGTTGTLGHVRVDGTTITANTSGVISVVPSGHTHPQYSTTGHTHNDIYYTESEVDSFLAGKSNTGHTHDYAASSHTTVKAGNGTNGTLGHVKADGTTITANTTSGLISVIASGHNHDDRYYTETEVDSKLANKSDTGHTTPIASTSQRGHVTVDGTSITATSTGKISVVASGHSHPQYSTTGHTHDDRYYTESEVNSFLAGKADSGHTTAIATTGATGHIKIDDTTVKLNDKNQLYVVNNAHTHNQYSPTGHNHDDIYYTETEVDSKLAGKANSGHTSVIAGSGTTGALGHVRVDGTTIAVNASNGVISIKDASKYSLTSHTHDDMYYTESEVDTFLAGKSNTGHTHDYAASSHTTVKAGNGTNGTLGHVKADGTTITANTSGVISVIASGHNHDDRYYTETEVDSKLAGKSDTGHTTPIASTTQRGHVTVDGTSITATSAGKISVVASGHSHPQYSTTGHTHDDRYYTESEVNSFLAGKADSGHTTVKAATGSTGTLGHVRADGTTIAVDSNAVISVIASGHSHPQYSQTSHTHDDRYYTESEVDSKLAGKAASGHTIAIAGSGTTGTLGHVRVDGTTIAINASGVIGVKDVSKYSITSHTHDDRYYTETEVDTFLAGKADSGHTHDYAASSHTTVKAGNGTSGALGHVKADGTTITANTTSGLISVIASGHNHDDRYYTESEVDGKLAGKAASGHTSVIAGSGTTGTLGHVRVDGTTITASTNGVISVVPKYSPTGHNHDDVYYTESEVDTFLAGKANSGHTTVIAGSGTTGTLGHVRVDGTTIAVNASNGVISIKDAGKYSLTSHTHDDRYYTEDEVDALISNALTSSVSYKGTTGATPSSSKIGDMYIASASFTVASGSSASGVAQTVEQGDYIICRTAGKWDVIQKNLTGATYKGSTWTDGQLVKVNGSNGEIVSCGYALSVVSAIPASPNANTIYILK